jgi:molybdenum cofactor biosynthesis enzyme MoaA
LDETNISALNIYSICLDNQGQFKEAIETINKAIKYIKNDQEQSSNKQEHVFQITNFLKPTFCDECHKLLLGFRKQGYQCLYCKINVHMNCSKNIELKCSFKTNLSLNNLEKRKHNFELHTFKKINQM